MFIESDDYTIAEIFKNDKRGNKAVEKLLNQEGIRQDKNLDYTCGVFDENYNLVVTGSCFSNILMFIN